MSFEVREIKEGEPYGNRGHTFHADPEQAVATLKRGASVAYQPGDGTRYVLMLLRRPDSSYDLVRKWLYVENFNVIFPLEKGIGHATYASMKCAPVGSWYALRPILAGLGAAPGPTHLMPYDRIQEASARADHHDGEPLDVKDARLGRQLRRLVEAER